MGSNQNSGYLDYRNIYSGLGSSSQNQPVYGHPKTKQNLDSIRFPNRFSCNLSFICSDIQKIRIQILTMMTIIIMHVIVKAKRSIIRVNLLQLKPKKLVIHN